MNPIEEIMSGRLKIGLTSGLWLFIVISSSFAQQSEEPLKFPEKLFLHDFVTDQRSIWTSPKHLKGHDLRWLVPFVSAGAVLIAEDNHIAKSLTYSPNQLSISHRFSDIGVNLMYGTLGALYLGGRLTHRERSLKTGLLGAEALAGGAVVIRLLKIASDRKRPFVPAGTGFLAGGESFPSGHSFSAWTVATVLSNRYPQKWIKFSSYGLASAVSIARCTGKNHYPADVLVGGVVGYLVGHFVSHR
jgi:membrane-associated phospholipid phosphatase